MGGGCLSTECTSQWPAGWEPGMPELTCSPSPQPEKQVTGDRGRSRGLPQPAGCRCSWVHLPALGTPTEGMPPPPALLSPAISSEACPLRHTQARPEAMFACSPPPWPSQDRPEMNPDTRSVVGEGLRFASPEVGMESSTWNGFPEQLPAVCASSSSTHTYFWYQAPCGDFIMGRDLWSWPLCHWPRRAVYWGWDYSFKVISIPGQ